MRIARLIACLPVLFGLAGCEKPAASGHVRLFLDRPQNVSIGLYDPSGKLVAQPVVSRHFEAGHHEINCTTPEVPEGEWNWRAVGFDRPQPELIASIGAGVSDLSRPDLLGFVAGGDAGPPCSVAADEQYVFLGWRSAVQGNEIVAVDPDGRVIWAHHHGPHASGVRSLAAADGAVFVLGGSVESSAEGQTLYKLDAQTGEPLPWEGRDGFELPIISLWPADAKDKPDRASGVAARNGRVYLTFRADQFIAGLDSHTGSYVITLTGPQPTELALSTTPMNDPERPGEQKIIDFGICSIAQRGLAYFLMDHEPAWVMASTTRWLSEDERIVALTIRGDTMKTDKIVVYTAIGAPHHQIQLRPAEAVEGFSVAIGTPGGRPESGPWLPDAFRDVRSLAIDSTGQLWVAEGGSDFGRFTTWRTDDKQGIRTREVFGPIKTDDFQVSATSPNEILCGGFRWAVDPQSHTASCLGTAATETKRADLSEEYRDTDGLLFWSAKMVSNERLPREGWQVIKLPNGTIRAALHRQGLHLFDLPGIEKQTVIGTGKISVARRH